jgi:soluble lytic murein transglycosylase-like protein
MISAIALTLMLNQNSNLESFMNTIAPHVGKHRIAYVANIIKRKSEKYNLDPFIFATIIKQESNFKADIVSCTVHSCDYGLAQINDINVDSNHLDKERLIHDDNYNLEIASKMLSNLKQGFPNEKNFFSRYHDSRPKERAKYEVSLNNWINMASVTAMGSDI